MLYEFTSIIINIMWLLTDMFLEVDHNTKKFIM